jgi:hypothetical protein
MEFFFLAFVIVVKETEDDRNKFPMFQLALQSLPLIKIA